jgi:ABC-type nitrate/sulfonate/bicarbonate transport system ATPase subunit
VTASARIQLFDASKTLSSDGEHGRQVLNRISLSLQPGEIGCIVGPSGCGKSTLLKLVGEIWQPDDITFEGRRTVQLDPTDREARAWLPQRTSLVPSLTARQNVAIAARVRTTSRQECDERTTKALATVEMLHAQAMRPPALSGGMQQRIALARVLAARPQIMLLDEPFTALDLALRRQIAERILHEVRERSAAALITSHTIEESVEVATRVYVLAGRPARIVAVVRPQSEPADRLNGTVDYACPDRVSMLARIYKELSALADQPFADQSGGQS